MIYCDILICMIDVGVENTDKHAIRIQLIKIEYNWFEQHSMQRSRARDHSNLQQQQQQQKSNNENITWEFAHELNK